MPIISVSHLAKYYRVQRKEAGIAGSLRSFFSREFDTIKAVDDISFTIEEGEVVGFIGSNGAGKTTTLKTLSGLLYPTHGSVSVLEHTPFSRQTEFLTKISLVMGQKNQLWWDLPAMETFLLNKEIYEIPQAQFKHIIGELSELLDVNKQLAIPVRRLSLGQRMKMELIAALIHSPKVLFLDEPTIGLDVIMQKKIREFLKAYNERYNATIILTSHYMGDVEALCKRVVIIDQGKLLYDGLLTNLVKKYAPYKRISVIFQEPVDPKTLKSIGETKFYDFPRWILHVPTAKVNSVAAHILTSYAVADVEIEDPEIEDVIRDVFTKPKEEK